LVIDSPSPKQKGPAPDYVGTGSSAALSIILAGRMGIKDDPNAEESLQESNKLVAKSVKDRRSHPRGRPDFKLAPIEFHFGWGMIPKRKEQINV